MSSNKKEKKTTKAIVGLLRMELYKNIVKKKKIRSQLRLEEALRDPALPVVTENFAQKKNGKVEGWLDRQIVPFHNLSPWFWVSLLGQGPGLT